MNGDREGAARPLTFLFTDIEGSTRLWEQEGETMPAALAEHDALLERAVVEAGGRVVKTTGDGIVAVFEDPAAAIGAAIAAQDRLQATEWPTTDALQVRVGVHCGPVVERGGDYFGTTMNRTARIMALGHGGQVLVSESVALLVREQLPPGIGLRDLGEHRLRDLTNVERVHQADADGLRREFPPLRSRDAYPSNLPAQLTSFIGREDEIEELKSLARRERLVTLTGVGGVGKTRLAVRVAAELLPDAPDGVWLCELATAESDDAVEELIASALSIVPRATIPVRESIVETLRDRKCVIVLDNCEHVLAAAADVAGAILQRCPDARILATSREGLGISGEQLRPLSSMHIPDEASAASVLSNDATTLFIERARAIAPAFTLDDGNAPAVVEICRRLDGIPLAIELAAARVASMQPGEIVALLDERFRLLTGSRRRTVERHQTLRAAVDWSYSLLSDVDRGVFDRLGVFTGSFDAAAATAVAASVDRFELLDALDELVAKSMLGTEGGDESTTRYRMLETLRQYALERLDASGVVDEVRQRHAEHFGTLTTEVGPLLGQPEEPFARARLLRDLDNVRVALEWAIDSGNTEVVVALLAPIASEAGLNRGTGVGPMANRAVELAPIDPPADWSWVEIAAGFFHYQDTGDNDRALELANAVIARPDVSAHAHMWACLLRSFVAMGLGDFESAIEQLAAEYAAHIDGTALNFMGTAACLAILCSFVDTARALEYAEDALKRAVALGAPSAIALAHFARGTVLLVHDGHAARRDLEAALVMADRGAGDVVADRPLIELANLAWLDGDTTTAADAVARGLRRSQLAGDYSACAVALPVAWCILGAHDGYELLVTVAAARDAGVFPAVMANPQRAYLDEACQAAIATAAEALGPDRLIAARRAGAAMGRDEVIRLTLAALRAIAAADQ
jgi:predicted ATPase